MKTIEDYIKLEPEFYKQIINDRKNLFNKNLMDISFKEIEELAIYATGSSSNAAYSAMPFISEVLGIPIRIEEPSISESYMIDKNKKTLHMVISQSGHSYSVIKMLKRLKENKHIVISLTSDKQSPLALENKYVLLMGMPIEEMPYVSAGYSVTILDLMLITLAIGEKQQKINKVDIEGYIAQIKDIISQYPSIIKKSNKWVNNWLADFDKAERVLFIGYGATYGVAREGETKLTETTHVSTWGKELEEYMHGPYLGLHSNDYIIFIESNGKLRERTKLLKKFLKKHVKNIFTIYSSPIENVGKRDLSLDIHSDELITSLFMTVPIHLLAFHLSKVKDFNLQTEIYPEFEKITGSKI